MKLKEEMVVREGMEKDRFVLDYEGELSVKKEKMRGGEGLIGLVRGEGELGGGGELMGVGEER
ncbi:hypothetical protein, partial [Bacillus subtilis]|uniref:hypothetical protein n=1 Tax=Bacillus subtilis TaxID=1423 RepID=UPI001642BA76